MLAWLCRRQLRSSWVSWHFIPSEQHSSWRCSLGKAGSAGSLLLQELASILRAGHAEKVLSTAAWPTESTARLISQFRNGFKTTSNQRRDHMIKKSEEGETRPSPVLPVLISVTHLEFLSWGWLFINVPNHTYIPESVYSRGCVYQWVCVPEGVCTSGCVYQRVCIHPQAQICLESEADPTGTETTAAGVKNDSKQASNIPNIATCSSNRF